MEDRLVLSTLPLGFSETLVTTEAQLSRPTAMEFSPVGELWVLEQDGAAKVIDLTSGQAALAGTLSVQSSGERGLLGIAFDSGYDGTGPNADNVYLYYTATTPNIHNRVSRFEVDHTGSAPTLGSETIIMEIAAEPEGDGSSNHNGGAMHFGIDGMLYVAVGDHNADGVDFRGAAHVSQRLDFQHGKMLRIDVGGDDFPEDPNRNYAIPPDNPFVDNDPGTFDEIWALGLRNPYTFAVQEATGRIFINDVGETQWEEINDGIGGNNYGWASEQTPGGVAEGFEPSAPSYATVGTYANPVMAYDHDNSPPSPAGCAITGGVFYPSGSQFGSEFAGKYFFADFCSDVIRVFDPSSPGSVALPDTSLDFASDLTAGNPVDLRVDAEGHLYYLARGGSGGVFRISLDEPANPTLDFGDAPSSYPVTLADDGARHTVTTLFLGAAVSSELDGIPSANADSDANDDGVTFISTIISSTIATTSSISVLASETGKIDGWIDINRDGDWLDPGEQILMSTDLVAGNNLVSFTIPANASAGSSAARFRFSTAGALAPTGAAADGEVEDYLVTLVTGSPTAELTIELPAGDSGIVADGNELIVKQGDVVLFNAPLVSFGTIDLVGSSLDDVLQLTVLQAIGSDTLNIDGGPGQDILELLEAGKTLDLTDAQISLKEIEEIDITGTGDNTLIISVADVKAASTATDTLEIVANVGDKVEFGEGWRIQTPSFAAGQLIHRITEAATGGTASVELRNDRWLQNPLNRFDADRNGDIQPLDALRIINELRRRGIGPITLPTNDTEVSHLYFDVSGDDQFTPLDALQVINALSRIHRGGSPEGEPSTPTTDLAPLEDSLLSLGDTPRPSDRMTHRSPRISPTEIPPLPKIAAVDQWMQEYGTQNDGQSDQADDAPRMISTSPAQSSRFTSALAVRAWDPLK